VYSGLTGDHFFSLQQWLSFLLQQTRALVVERLVVTVAGGAVCAEDITH
jgi:hypothetical protein